MQKELGKDIDNPLARVQFLKDNCDEIQELDYMRQFKPDELVEMKDSLSTVAIQIDDLEGEKKDLTAEINAKIKTQSLQKKKLLKGLKQKAELVNEPCFKFIDDENRMVGFYNSDGDLVQSRPAMGNELQKTIFQVQKAI